MDKTRAARHRCNDDRAKERPERDENSIPRDFERGSLVAGLLVAVMAGVPMLVQAVM